MAALGTNRLGGPICPMDPEWGHLCRSGRLGGRREDDPAAAHRFLRPTPLRKAGLAALAGARALLALLEVMSRDFGNPMGHRRLIGERLSWDDGERYRRVCLECSILAGCGLHRTLGTLGPPICLRTPSA